MSRKTLKPIATRTFKELDVTTQNEGGFKLLETVIIISIITILSTVIARAVPIARSNQQIVSDTQTIRALIQDATNRALNEVRPDECTINATDDRLCSDVGVHVRENRATLFADLNQDKLFSTDDDYEYEIIFLQTTIENERTFVFEASPPNIILFADGTVINANTPASFTLVTPHLSRTLSVLPYGQVENTAP